MIGVKFNGRLGNQIFQYAFYCYLKSNNKGIFFFVNPHHSSLSRYFTLDTFNNLTLHSKVYSILTRTLPTIIPFDDKHVENIHVPKHIEVKTWSVYRGFFQTDWYLDRIRGEFRLTLKKQYLQEFKNSYGSLFKNYKTIVVHVRRTDYLKYGKRDISLPLDYFKHRLDRIKKVEEYKVLFVSDDIAAVKSYFGVKDNYIFSTNKEIVDFQIIMNADIAIISNSSFAWWAAYLSPKTNIVYAPKNWLGFRIGKEHPKRVMTKKFIWCDVFDRTTELNK